MLVVVVASRINDDDDHCDDADHDEDAEDADELDPDLEMKYRQIMAKRNGGRVFDFGPVDEQLKDYWNSLSYISINSIVKVVDLPETQQVKVMTLEFL